MKRFFVVAVVALFFTGGGAHAQSARDKAMQAANAFMQRSVAALNSRNPDTAASLCVPDAVIVGPTGEAATNPKEYYVSFFKLLGNFTFSGKVEHAHINGATLWFTGKGGFKLSNPSGPAETHTHFAYVLVKQGKGWKVQMISAGFDAPAPK